jgi:hypothetical protein
VKQNKCNSKGVPGQATARLRSAERPARASRRGLQGQGSRRNAPTAEVKRRGLSGRAFAARASERKYRMRRDPLKHAFAAPSPAHQNNFASSCWTPAA